MEGKNRDQALINNAFYDDLGRDWYEAHDHPVALLRAENALRTPWVIDSISHKKGKVLDIGCGAGLLTNALAKEGYNVTGIDLSESSLEMAQAFDSTKSVEYLYANAYSLPFQDNAYDAVCAMDVLEHVQHPEKLLQEASRVLRPGGQLFFHTFNRNPLSYVMIIKGVEWFVKNAPKNMHVYPLFLKPEELEKLCKGYNLDVVNWKGMRPKINGAFWKMLWTGVIDPDFSFIFTKNLATGYCGIAEKQQS